VIILNGEVFSGTGNGKKFIDLPWVKQQIEEKLGFSPYSGTLNIHLNKDGMEKKNLIEKGEGITVKPQPGYCLGILFRARIGSLEGAILIPKVLAYPSDVLEIIAPVYLRNELKLVDGSLVTVKINV
jgi:riboflavin kinase